MRHWTIHLYADDPRHRYAASAGLNTTAVDVVALADVRDVIEERDRYRQALIDIAGHENWEPKTMGDIARDALDPERRKDSRDV